MALCVDLHSLYPHQSCPATPPSAPRPSWKRKWRGRILGQLREQYKLVGDQRITPHSAAARLGQAEMRTALSHHLVSLAWETLEVLHTPVWADVGSALGSLRRALASGEITAATEAQAAALASLAARKSSHSAITGVSEGRASHAAGAVARGGLGIGREGACSALLHRAVAMAAETGAFEAATQDNINTLTLLRIAVGISAPRERLMLPILDALRAHYLAGAGAGMPDSIVAADAGAAVCFDRSLAVSDAELGAFGWSAFDELALRRRLAAARFGSKLDGQLLHDMREYTVAVTRKIATYQLRGWSKRDPYRSLAVPAEPFFAELSALARALEQLTVAINAASTLSSPPLVAHLKKTSQVHRLATFFHSSAVKLARQLVAADVDPEGEAILRASQLAYLTWLRRLIAHLSWGVGEAPEPLSLALILDGLELLAGWLELAIEGARQCAEGEGPLAEARFSWDDLRQLQPLLKLSATVFPRADACEQVLATELSVLDLAGGAGAVKAADDPVAERILQSAVDELLET